MHMRKFSMIGLISALACGGWAWSPGLAAGQAVDGEGYEVMTRGPVHEAFAGTISYDPEPGIVVKIAPPELVEEIPPDHRPEGDNVTWIPGYWGWDEEQEIFLWISGIWRNLPPGREWVPGYWNEVVGAYQWISGFWEDATLTEVSYLPEPPRSLESGPSVAAISSEQIWIPGSWVWYETRYAWRSGYWTAPRENWVWTPSVYRWTPRGHIYVDGYWDYPVVSRGVLFAPVYFRQPIYTRPGYFYRPTTVININVFVNHLFLRPSYCHYYFGDYYAPIYRDRGLYASYHFHTVRRGYDPIYAQRRWENRHDRRWDQGRREYFEQRRDNESARPPRTWSELSARPERDRRQGDFVIAESLDRVVADRSHNKPRFQAVAAADRERLVAQGQEVQKFGEERRSRETRAARPQEAVPQGGSRVIRTETRRSPIASRSSERTADRTAGRNLATPPTRLGDGESAVRQAPWAREDRTVTASSPEGQIEPQTAPQTGRRTEAQAARRADPARDSEVSPLSAGQQAGSPPERLLQPSTTGGGKAAPPGRRSSVPLEREASPSPSARETAPGRQTVPRPSRPAERQQTAPPPSRTEPSSRVAPSTPSRPQASPQRPQVQPQRQQVQPQRQQVQPQRQQVQPQRSSPAPARPERRGNSGVEQERIRRSI